MTKIEEVARAIAQAETDLSGAAVTGDAFPHPPSRKSIALALAAVRAMREPSEAMIEGMQGASVGGELFYVKDYQEAFRLAIDAVLAEHTI